MFLLHPDYFPDDSILPRPKTFSVAVQTTQCVALQLGDHILKHCPNPQLVHNYVSGFKECSGDQHLERASSTDNSGVLTDVTDS